MICFNRSPGESRDPFDNILGAARWVPAFAGTAGFRTVEMLQVWLFRAMSGLIGGGL
jgi:hypothetical protein